MAEHFAAAAGRAGVRRIVYLGGLVPPEGPTSRHLASRLAVEAGPERGVALDHLVDGGGDASRRAAVAAHAVAILEQAGDEGGSDVARGSGDEDLHGSLSVRAQSAGWTTRNQGEIGMEIAS